MYSIVLAMALSQAPAPMVVQDTSFYQGPAQSGEPARRGLFRGRFGRWRNRGTGSGAAYYEGGPVVNQAPMPMGPNSRSYYTPPVPEGPAPARMVVHVPPGAALTVDGSPTQQTSSTRVFITPALEPGKEYTYELKAKVPQPGGEVSSIVKVRVHPGQDTEVVMLPGSMMNQPGSMMNVPGSMPPVEEAAPGNIVPTRRRILRR